jgi:hypothetical protein
MNPDGFLGFLSGFFCARQKRNGRFLGVSYKRNKTRIKAQTRDSSAQPGGLSRFRGGRGTAARGELGQSS